MPGAARALAIQTQPGPNAIVGTVFDAQPEVSTIDQFGNACYMDVTTVVTAARVTGTAALLGTLKQTVIGGIASFTDLSANVADTITIRFTATSKLVGKASGVMKVTLNGDTLALKDEDGTKEYTRVK